MRILGVVLAGGASRRFGSDKALVLYDGRPLIEHAVAALSGQVAAVAVSGREWAGLPVIADRPATGLGPLGGLCGALAFAATHGFDAVLTTGCDLLGVPGNLAARLAPGPSVAAGQPLLGLWSVALSGQLDAHLARGDRSMRGWVAATAARTVDLGPIRNINTPADLLA